MGKGPGPGFASFGSAQSLGAVAKPFGPGGLMYPTTFGAKPVVAFAIMSRSW